MRNREYLGDSVYVQLDGSGNIILTTENGLPEDPSNTICLEPEVYWALAEYVESLKRKEVKTDDSETTKED